MNYDDVVAMTNDKKTLIINMGTGDVLNFQNMGHVFTDKGHVLVDETRGAVSTGTTTDDTNYHVYTDGHVTLLVNDSNGGTVTGI